MRRLSWSMNSVADGVTIKYSIDCRARRTLNDANAEPLPSYRISAGRRRLAYAMPGTLPHSFFARRRILFSNSILTRCDSHTAPFQHLMARRSTALRCRTLQCCKEALAQQKRQRCSIAASRRFERHAEHFARNELRRRRGKMTCVAVSSRCLCRRYDAITQLILDIATIKC